MAGVYLGCNCVLTEPSLLPCRVLPSHCCITVSYLLSTVSTGTTLKHSHTLLLLL